MPEYEQYAEALRAELKLFAAGRPPYAYGHNLDDDEADNCALTTHAPYCPERYGCQLVEAGPRSWASDVPWFWLFVTMVTTTLIITMAATWK